MLDISTLYVMVALCSLVAGIVHVVARIGGRFGSWADWWGGGHLLLGASAVMPLTLDYGAADILRPLGNVVAVLSYTAIYIGARTFGDSTANNRLWILAGIVAALPMLVWKNPADMGLRIAYLSVVRSLFDIATVVVAVRIARRESLQTGWIVATMFALTVPLFLGRGWMAVTGAIGAQPTGMHGGPAAWLAAGSIAFIMFRGFSLLTMDAERGEQRLSILAERDALTGASNRNGFERARPNWRGDGAVLMIDLNRFKVVNDRYGHATGDAALRVATRAAVTSIPMSGRVFRWGGDEFVCVLPGVDAASAAAIAEGIANRFIDGTTALLDGTTTMTLSVGWTTGSLLDLDPMVATADEHMYRRKKAMAAIAMIPQRSVAEQIPARRLISQAQHG